MTVQIEIVGSFTDNASSGLQGFAGTLGNLGNIVTGIKSAFDLVGSAIDATVGFITPFIESASESEQAVADLEATLKSTGGAVGLTSEQLQAMADQFQNMTKFSDEAVISGEAMLLTFTNIGGDVFPQATEAMLNLAEKFGSVDSAAVQLGKALNDPISGITALSRVGVSFTDEQKDMIKTMMEAGDTAGAQGVILAELEKEFGGLAEAMGDTFEGRWTIFQNQLDSVKETIGGALLPILGGLIDKVSEALPALQVWAGALAVALDTGNFSALFATFEDGTSYLGGFINMLGVGEEKAEAFASAIFDLLGGDFSTLGEMFVNWTLSIDWNKLSDNIAAGISGIDWGKIGNMISEGLGYIVMGLAVIIEKIDWGTLLNSAINGFLDLIGGLFGFVDWDDMWASALVGFSYIGNQIKNFFVGIWSNISDWWSSLDWGNIGQSVVDGLVAGFRVTPIGQITFWFADLIEKIKDVFGIASPSSVFYNIAHDIIQGLINGWNAFWGDLVDLAANSLEDFLGMFGIDVSLGGGTLSGGVATHSGPGGTTGTSGGGSGTGAPGTGTSGQVVTINNYGPSYWGVGGPGDVSGVYDCPSPNPFVDASTGVVGGLGGGAVGGRVGGR